MKTLNHKVEYLTKLVDKLLPFSKYWNNVTVTHVGDIVAVQWFEPKVTGGKDTYMFDMKEIPIEDIDTAVLHYQNKLRYELNKRNNGKA